MRNKVNIQRSLAEIEAIQQSLIQFIRNTPMSDLERETINRSLKDSNRLFDQIRTFLNQEQDDWGYR